MIPSGSGEERFDLFFSFPDNNHPRRRRRRKKR
jgi:hypothetical protein